jgi:hypothetical protein
MPAAVASAPGPCPAEIQISVSASFAVHPTHARRCGLLWECHTPRIRPRIALPELPAGHSIVFC